MASLWNGYSSGFGIQRSQLKSMCALFTSNAMHVCRFHIVHGIKFATSPVHMSWPVGGSLGRDRQSFHSICKASSLCLARIWLGHVAKGNAHTRTCILVFRYAYGMLGILDERLQTVTIRCAPRDVFLVGHTLRSDCPNACPAAPGQTS